MNIIRCAHCGTTNRAGSNFCNRCGTALRDPEEEAAGTTEPMVPDANRETNEIDAGSQSDSSQSTSENSATTKQGPSALPVRSTQAQETAGRQQEQGAYSPMDGSSEQEPERLVDGIQGLLEPTRIASELGERESAQPHASLLSDLTIPLPQLRRIRTIIAEDPTLVEHQFINPASTQTRLRYPWLITLILLALGIPLLLNVSGPVGEARQWPGVTDTYSKIDELATDDVVWIFWAYDPATSGEMDLVALPLADHLLERKAQVVVLSLLPTGLAVAQRLWENAAETIVVERGLGANQGRTIFVAGAYLPGGAPALSLLAASPVDALWGYTDRTTHWLSLVNLYDPALAVVVAAHPEDVQHWLELVQTETQLPTVAFTGAGADPILRPYLASGQLAGLVSGFDGAAAYQQLRDRRFGRLPSQRYRMQLIAQNWGHAVLLLLLLFGNLRAIWLGGNRG